MNYRTKSKKKAQILLVTLLVLTVVAMAVSGTVILLNRDVGQVSTSQKYQQIYNVAESQLQRVIEKYGNYNEDLNNIGNDFATCSSVQQEENNIYECTFSDEINAATTIDTSLTAIDSKNINELSIKKDQALTVNLNGYRNGVQINWGENFAMELSITYFIDANGNSVWDNNEEIQNIGDVYDLQNVFDSREGNDPNSESVFNFSIFDAENVATSLQFTVSSIDNFQANYYPMNLTVIPRSNLSSLSSTKISITPTDPSVFPYQIRSFEAKSFDSEDPSSPVATVESFIPLGSQIDSIFNYAFITKDTLTL